jgi:hypothetical protein
MANTNAIKKVPAGTAKFPLLHAAGGKPAPAPTILRMPELPPELLTNAFLFRRDLFSKLLDTRRNIDAECGYPDIITPQTYRAVYDRMGLGTRVVSVYPEESWSVDPEIYDDEDPSTETDFESETKQLIKKKNLWH